MLVITKVGDNMWLDFEDESLCDALNRVISGMLPHDNYDNGFAKVYPALSIVLDKSSVSGIHYIFFSVFEKYYTLKNAINQQDFAVRITRERFESALVNNLPDWILEPQLKLSDLMNKEGKSADINIPTVQEEAMQIVFSYAMNLYDTCFDMALRYDDALASIVDLKDCIRLNVIETGLQMQRKIVSTGMNYKGKFYRGSTGWLMFSQILIKEVAELDSRIDGALMCNSLDILPQLEASATEMSVALANYGIPQLDDKTPMLRHRLVVFVAKENTGKTRVVTHLIATLIRAGVKPYFACGEMSTELAFLQVVSSYIYQEYGLYFETTDLVGDGYNILSEEDKQVVQTAKAAVSLSGAIFDSELEYDNVIPTFEEAYGRGCEAFFIDHTQTLKYRQSRGRTMKDMVSQLAIDCRNFKREYPVYVCLTSHPSVDLKDLFQKDKTTDIQKSPTAQSATVSQEADELFILVDSEYLSKQNLLQWIVYKRRFGIKPPPFYIRKLFNVSSYEYCSEGANIAEISELDEMVRQLGDDGDISDEYDSDITDLQVDF